MDERASDRDYDSETPERPAVSSGRASVTPGRASVPDALRVTPGPDAVMPRGAAVYRASVAPEVTDWTDDPVPNMPAPRPGQFVGDPAAAPDPAFPPRQSRREQAWLGLLGPADQDPPEPEAPAPKPFIDNPVAVDPLPRRIARNGADAPWASFAQGGSEPDEGSPWSAFGGGSESASDAAASESVSPAPDAPWQMPASLRQPPESVQRSPEPWQTPEPSRPTPEPSWHAPEQRQAPEQSWQTPEPWQAPAAERARDHSRPRQSDAGVIDPVSPAPAASINEAPYRVRATAQVPAASLATPSMADFADPDAVAAPRPVPAVTPVSALPDFRPPSVSTSLESTTIESAYDSPPDEGPSDLAEPPAPARSSERDDQPVAPDRSESGAFDAPALETPAFEAPAFEAPAFDDVEAPRARSALFEAPDVPDIIELPSRRARALTIDGLPSVLEPPVPPVPPSPPEPPPPAEPRPLPPMPEPTPFPSRPEPDPYPAPQPPPPEPPTPDPGPFPPPHPDPTPPPYPPGPTQPSPFPTPPPFPPVPSMPVDDEWGGATSSDDRSRSALSGEVMPSRGAYEWAPTPDRGSPVDTMEAEDRPVRADVVRRSDAALRAQISARLDQAARAEVLARPGGAMRADPAVYGAFIGGSESDISDISDVQVVSNGHNGSTINGSSSIGSTYDASPVNGSTVNGSVHNGSDLNGSTLNGSDDNGTPHNGSAYNGSAHNGSANGSTYAGESVGRSTAFRAEVPQAARVRDEEDLDRPIAAPRAIMPTSLGSAPSATAVLPPAAIVPGNAVESAPEAVQPGVYSNEDWRSTVRGSTMVAAESAGTVYRDGSTTEEEDEEPLSMAQRLLRIGVVVALLGVLVIAFLYGPAINVWLNS